MSQFSHINTKGIKIFKDGTFTFSDNKGSWLRDKINLYLFSGKQITNLPLISNKIKNSILEGNPLSKKYFVMIITCRKNIERIKILRKLWVRDLFKLGIRYLFIIGDDKLKTSKVINDILFVKCKDDYESLPHKVYEGLSYISKNFMFEYVYKIDDDCILNPLLLFTINTNNNNDLYIGKKKTVDYQSFNRFWHKGKCKNQRLNQIAYPSNRIFNNTYHAKGESGYFLHRKVIPLILNMKSYIYSDLYEDKVIGDVLRFNNIYLKDKPNYKAKLFVNTSNINYNNFTIVVDIPINYLETIYNKNNISY